MLTQGEKCRLLLERDESEFFRGREKEGFMLNFIKFLAAGGRGLWDQKGPER